MVQANQRSDGRRLEVFRERTTLECCLLGLSAHRKQPGAQALLMHQRSRHEGDFSLFDQIMVRNPAQGRLSSPDSAIHISRITLDNPRDLDRNVDCRVVIRRFHSQPSVEVLPRDKVNRLKHVGGVKC